MCLAKVLEVLGKLEAGSLTLPKYKYLIEVT